jgi:hypothetical protein
VTAVVGDEEGDYWRFTKVPSASMYFFSFLGIFV